MRRSDIISGSLLLVSGLMMIFVIVPAQINSSGDYGLDPAFFPLALVWLLVIMGGLLVVTRIVAPAAPADSEPVLDLKNWLFIGGFSVFLVIVFVAIDTLGFMIAGALTIAALMAVLGFRHLNWIELIGVSVIAPFAIYYTLYHLFAVQLPSGSVFP